MHKTPVRKNYAFWAHTYTDDDSVQLGANCSKVRLHSYEQCKMYICI